MICFQYCFSFIGLESWITIHPMKRLWSTVRIQSSSKLFLRSELTGLLFTNGFLSPIYLCVCLFISPKNLFSSHFTVTALDKKTTRRLLWGSIEYPPAKFNSSPLKNGGKGRRSVSYLGPGNFSGVNSLWNFRRVVKILVHLEGREESRRLKQLPIRQNLEAERLAQQPGLVEALCDQQLGPEVPWEGGVGQWKSGKVGLRMECLKAPQKITRRWFQISFIFTSTWGNDPNWLIFFRWVIH